MIVIAEQLPVCRVCQNALGSQEQVRRKIFMLASITPAALRPADTKQAEWVQKVRPGPDVIDLSQPFAARCGRWCAIRTGTFPAG